MDKYIQQVRARLMEVDSDAEITDSDVIVAIGSAVAQHSSFRPSIRMADLPPNATYDLPLPQAWDDSAYEPLSVEYPIGNRVPTLLKSTSYTVYQSPTGYVLRLLDIIPTTPLRLTYRCPHTVSFTENTIPNSAFEAVACLSASYAARALGVRCLRPWSNTLSADFINWGQKADQYFALARQLEATWRLAIGENSLGPAASFGQLPNRRRSP